jgi:hypothetical protein
MPRATNEKRRQHTTYCCLPLANNTRMNGARKMTENREANYSDASLGWVSWPSLKLQLEQKQGWDSLLKQRRCRGSACWGRESESIGRNSKIGPTCRGIDINLDHFKIVYWAAIEMVHK